jgi:hypothetical protein
VKEVRATDGSWHSERDTVRLRVGTTAHWRITVTNTGNVALTDIVATDAQVKSGSRTIDYLAIGAEAAWEYESVVGKHPLQNVVTVTAQAYPGASTAGDGELSSTADAGYIPVDESGLAVTGGNPDPAWWVFAAALLILGIGLIVRRRVR